MPSKTNDADGSDAAATVDDGAAPAVGAAKVTAADIGDSEEPAVEPSVEGGATEGDALKETGVADLKSPPEVDAPTAAAASAGTEAAAPADATEDAIAAAAAIPVAAAAAAGEDLQLGIPRAALLAPVPPPPKKKRKQQDEFTIDQKLVILEELKSGSLSVPDLAAKHSTSRTSIYRWKKDHTRLLKLRNRDGKGQSKRVAQKRKTFNEEYTAEQKLAVVRELKGEDAPSVKVLAERVGANHRSIYRWKKDEAKLQKLVEEDRGDAKRAGDDPLHRVKEGLRMFKADLDARIANGETVQGLTGTTVAMKAKQIRDEMLAQHASAPFLTDDEVRGMRGFKASTSWGRKTMHKFGWKGVWTEAEAGVKKDDGDDAKISALEAKPAASTAIEDILGAPPKRAKKAPSAAEQKRVRKMAELKRELKATQRQLTAAERENALLRSRVADATRATAQAVGEAERVKEENERLRTMVASLASGSADAPALPEGSLVGDGGADAAAAAADADVGASDAVSNHDEEDVHVAV